MYVGVAWRIEDFFCVIAGFTCGFIGADWVIAGRNVKVGSEDGGKTDVIV